MNRSQLEEDTAYEQVVQHVVTVDKSGYAVHVESLRSGLFSGLDEVAFNMTDAFIYVYDERQRSTQESFAQVHDSIIAAKGVQKAPVLIVGYRPAGCGGVSLEVGIQEGRKLAEYYGCLFRSLSDELGGIGEESDAVTAFAMRCLGDVVRQVHSYGVVVQQGGADRAASHHVMLVGDLFVGKTALVQKLREGTFRRRYVSTADDDDVEVAVGSGAEGCTLRITDTGGYRAGAKYSKEYILPIQGAIVMYSVTSQASFACAERLARSIMQFKPDSKLPMLLLGNKSDDTVNRQVGTDDGKQLARKLGALWAESSVLEDDIADVLQPLLAALRVSSSTSIDDSAVRNIQAARSDIVMFRKGGAGSWAKKAAAVEPGMLTYGAVDGKPSARTQVPLPEGAVIEVEDYVPRAGFPVCVRVNRVHISIALPNEEGRDAWLTTLRLCLAVEQTVSSIMDDVMMRILWEECSALGARSRSAATRRPPSGSVDAPAPPPREDLEHSSPELDERRSSDDLPKKSAVSKVSAQFARRRGSFSIFKRK